MAVLVAVLRRQRLLESLVRHQHEAEVTLIGVVDALSSGQREMYEFVVLTAWKELAHIRTS